MYQEWVWVALWANSYTKPSRMGWLTSVRIFQQLSFQPLMRSPVLHHNPTRAHPVRSLTQFQLLLGAAALAAGVTHTLSTAIIMLEMSGQLNLVAPIMVAVSCAVATSRMLSVNYYDKTSILRNLPYLPDLEARYGIACSTPEPGAPTPLWCAT